MRAQSKNFKIFITWGYLWILGGQSGDCTIIARSFNTKTSSTDLMTRPLGGQKRWETPKGNRAPKDDERHDGNGRQRTDDCTGAAATAADRSLEAPPSLDRHGPTTATPRSSMTRTGRTGRTGTGHRSQTRDPEARN